MTAYNLAHRDLNGNRIAWNPKKNNQQAVIHTRTTWIMKKIKAYLLTCLRKMPKPVHTVFTNIG